MEETSGEITESIWHRTRGKSWLLDAPVKPKYSPQDIADIDYKNDVGEPGEYPFVRGIYPEGYRPRLWTMRPIMAYGSPEDTRNRIDFLAKEGASTPQIVPDIATVNVVDSDHPLARSGVGMQGMSFPSLKEMELLMEGCQKKKRNFNLVFTTNFAPIGLAQYITVAQRRGLDISKFRGTIQNEPIKGRWSGYEPGVRYLDLNVKLSGDVSEFCIKKMPLYTCLNLNSAHAVSTGASPGFCLGSTLAIGLEHLKEIERRGIKVEELARRMAIVVGDGDGINFFETLAANRAARKVWSRILKKKFGITDRKCQLKIAGAGALGNTLYAQEPLNNIVRLTIGALANVMSGIQSLAVVGYDESISIPTEESLCMSLRIQQIIAFESGVANVVDPLGGSYYVESLTKLIEDEAMATIEKIEGMGGIMEAIKWLDDKFESATQETYQRILKGKKPIVGVNAFRIPEEEYKTLPAFKVPPDVAEKQISRLKELRETRKNRNVEMSLNRLYEKAYKKQENLMPYIQEAVKSYATIGEIYGIIKEAWGYPYDAFGVLQSPLH